MALDVEPPPPPTLVADEDDADDEYRRRDIEEHLAAGAWVEAFDHWARDTGMEADAYRIARDLELFERFDFFWDRFAQRVGYSAPGVPEDWQRADYHEALDSWRQVSSINAGLAELGQEVCEVLRAEYLEVDDEDWGEDLDLPEFD